MTREELDPASYVKAHQNDFWFLTVFVHTALILATQNNCWCLAFLDASNKPKRYQSKNGTKNNSDRRTVAISQNLVFAHM